MDTENSDRNTNRRPSAGGRGGERRRFLFLSLSLFPLSACGPTTAGGREANDRDIERDILWELRKDRRFADIRVACYDRVVTLEGTVPDRSAQDEALRIAAEHAYRAKLVNSLTVKPR